MDNESFVWHIIKVFFFAIIAFLLAFPLSVYTANIIYPTFASVEILLNGNEGSFKDFFSVIVYLMTAYFIYSLCYFFEMMIEWAVLRKQSRSGKEE